MTITVMIYNDFVAYEDYSATLNDAIRIFNISALDALCQSKEYTLTKRLQQPIPIFLYLNTAYSGSINTILQFCSDNKCTIVGNFKDANRSVTFYCTLTNYTNMTNYTEHDVLAELNVLSILDVNEEEVRCTGLIFKAYVSDYIDKKGAFCHTEKLTRVIKKSCTCVRCAGLYETLLQDYANRDYPYIDGHEPVHDKQFYTLTVDYSNVHRSEDCDHADLKFVPIFR